MVGYFSRQFLEANAREQVDAQARLMMDTALAVRRYTATHVQPILMDSETHSAIFHPESVPAFSATEVFLKLRESNNGYADYAYKEAVLNPTNPRDQARDWEEDIVNEFRNRPDRKQIRGQRGSATGDLMYLAQTAGGRDEGRVPALSRPARRCSPGNDQGVQPRRNGERLRLERG